LFEPPLQTVVIGRVFFKIFANSGQGAWGQETRTGIGVGTAFPRLALHRRWKNRFKSAKPTEQCTSR
jgi:hypothetical protein